MSEKDEVIVESKPSFDPSAFAQATKDELGKVSWPSRSQLISESIAVIIMVSLSATLVYFLDKVFSTVQLWVFK